MNKYFVKINRPRNKFNMPFDVETTFNPAKVVPLAWFPILPGDTFDCKVSFILRMLTPVNPVMDNARLKLQAVFCPYEILFSKTREFFGEADPGTWEPLNLSLPYLTGTDVPAGGYEVGSLGDYLELPCDFSFGSLNTDQQNIKFSTLPLRAYLATWNYWWRDENLVPKALYPIDGGSSADTYSSYSVHYQDEPLPAMKEPDYFTTCLPFTSKIAPVELAGAAPVTAGTSHSQSGLDLIWSKKDGSYLGDGKQAIIAEGGISKTITGVAADAVNNAVPGNLWAQNASLTIETFRRALVYQHVGEILARGGSRYATEFLANIFGVENSESLLNSPEHLGSFEVPINMTEVLSNSDTADSGGRFLGDNGAMSKTTGSGDYLFQHSFSRHGLILIVAAVRHDEHYYSGLPRKFTDIGFWDQYIPQAQGLGYQKVYTREIYATTKYDKVFGYQDYGAHYRYQPNRLAGYMRPIVDESLKTWTYASMFASAPTLNEDFIKADASGFNRVTAVDLTKAHMFFGNFHFSMVATRVVGIQRFPGLNYV